MINLPMHDSPTCGNRLDPFISVIMPVRNEERCIGRTIESLLRQDYPHNRYELLVVDGRSDDRTREIVEGYASRHRHIRRLDNPKCLSSAARNVGLRESQGEIVLIVDGHCQIDDQRHLANLADAFLRSGGDCIGRPQPLEIEGATTIQQAIAAARGSRLGHHPASYIYSNQEGFVPAKSVAVAYRREVFEQIGLFDESFDACEDVEFNHRVDLAGLRCFFSPSAAVHYAPRSTLSGLARQLVRYGRGRMRLARKHPDTISLGSLLPALLVVGFILGGLLSFVAPSWYPSVYLGTVGVYVTAILANSAVVAIARRKATLFVTLPIVYLTIHVSSGIGVLAEFLRPTSSATAQDPMHDEQRLPVHRVVVRAGAEDIC
jgi:succinoglycan biosynthesis protein ExoA